LAENGQKLKSCWLKAAKFKRMSYIKLPYLKSDMLVDFYQCALDELKIEVEQDKITVE